MIRVCIDQFGDMELLTEDYSTVNDRSDFARAGIAIPGCYEVDTTEFEGATPLYRGCGRYLVNYSPEGVEDALVFCSLILKKIFGEVPAEIWVREAI